MEGTAIQRAAQALRHARALLITAGAGMGVDSGLHDFRGATGFWKAYPPYRELGLAFHDLANPAWFRRDPMLAWGFYGHRLELYRRTAPHAGFGLLRAWGEAAEHGAWVFTSNVDGQFQRAGFSPNRIHECHGALDVLQCLAECGVGLFAADGQHVDVDLATFRARPPLPRCPSCGGLARPNVLMFGDGGWDDSRSSSQWHDMEGWLDGVPGDGLVVVECGAGTAIPTVRRLGEALVRHRGATLVRINPHDPDVPPNQVSVPMHALDALKAIQAAR